MGELSNGTDSRFVRFMIKWQAFTYFPILLLARISWLNESFKTAFGLGAATANAALELERSGLQYPKLERGGLILHYLWMFALCSGFGKFPLGFATVYFFIATCSSGFLSYCFWSRTQRNGNL